MILRQQKTLSNNHYDFNQKERKKQRSSYVLSIIVNYICIL